MTWDQHVVSNFKPHYFAPWVQVCMHCSFCSGRRTLERLWSPSLDLRHAFLNEDCCMEAMFLIAASIPIAFGLPRLQLVCAGKRGLARCAGLPGRTFSVVALVLLELPMPQTLLEPSQLCLWWLSIFSECGFCQVTAQFLAEEGAKSICLLSRGGRAPTEAKSDSGNIWHITVFWISDSRFKMLYRYIILSDTWNRFWWRCKDAGSGCRHSVASNLAAKNERWFIFVN